MKNVHEPTYSFLFLVIGLIIINTVISRLAIILVPAGQTGVAVIYFPVVIMLLFTFWFGAYGAISAYVGAFFGAGLLSGIPFDVSVYWAFANLWQVLIPANTSATVTLPGPGKRPTRLPAGSLLGWSRRPRSLQWILRMPGWPGVVSG